jgi:hypothetical protein
MVFLWEKPTSATRGSLQHRWHLACSRATVKTCVCNTDHYVLNNIYLQDFDVLDWKWHCVWQKINQINETVPYLLMIYRTRKILNDKNWILFVTSVLLVPLFVPKFSLCTQVRHWLFCLFLVFVQTEMKLRFKWCFCSNACHGILGVRGVFTRLFHHLLLPITSGIWGLLKMLSKF